MTSISKKAEPDIIELTKEALCEMAPLEAGYLLRDLGLNFPTTMDALRHAKKGMGMAIRTIISKPAIKDMCLSVGFTQEQVNKSTKLEVIRCLGYVPDPFVRYCLRGDLNKLVTQTRVGQNQ